MLTSNVDCLIVQFHVLQERRPEYRENGENNAVQAYNYSDHDGDEVPTHYLMTREESKGNETERHVKDLTDCQEIPKFKQEFPLP